MYMLRLPGVNLLRSMWETVTALVLDEPHNGRAGNVHMLGPTGWAARNYPAWSHHTTHVRQQLLCGRLVLQCSERKAVQIVGPPALACSAPLSLLSHFTETMGGGPGCYLCLAWKTGLPMPQAVARALSVECSHAAAGPAHARHSQIRLSAEHTSHHPWEGQKQGAESPQT